VARFVLDGVKARVAKGSCAQPARAAAAAQASSHKEVPTMTAQVGKPAPDFEASAFVQGTFKNVKLSDYNGHWVMLCFYPGDFTFV